MLGKQDQHSHFLFFAEIQMSKALRLNMAAQTRALLSPLGITPVLVRVEAIGPPAHSASQASESLVV